MLNCPEASALKLVPQREDFVFDLSTRHSFSGENHAHVRGRDADLFCCPGLGEAKVDEDLLELGWFSISTHAANLYLI